MEDTTHRFQTVHLKRDGQWGDWAIVARVPFASCIYAVLAPIETGDEGQTVRTSQMIVMELLEETSNSRHLKEVGNGAIVQYILDEAERLLTTKKAAEA